MYQNSETKTTNGAIKGSAIQTFYNEKFFYLNDNNQMVFKNYRPENSPSSRVELRSSKNNCFTKAEISCQFNILDNNTMSAVLTLSDSNADEYTWMQLHRIGIDGESTRPPLRLVWVKNNAGYEDYLWAVFFKHNPESEEGYRGNYKYIPLIQRSNSTMEASISTANNIIAVVINGNTLAYEDYTKDLNNWSCNNNSELSGNCSYFKTGIYMSGGRTSDVNAAGKATVIFDQLAIDLAP